MKKLIIILFALAWFNSCDDGPVFPEVPEIYFVSATPTSVQQFAPLEITIHYQDGDGDLGFLDENNPVQNLFLVDTRASVPDSVRTVGYAIPNLTPVTRRPSIQGNITVSLVAPPHGSFFDPNITGDDEVIFDIYLVDRADHISNVIQSDPITIRR